MIILWEHSIARKPLCIPTLLFRVVWSVRTSDIHELVIPYGQLSGRISQTSAFCGVLESVRFDDSCNTSWNYSATEPLVGTTRARNRMRTRARAPLDRNIFSF